MFLTIQLSGTKYTHTTLILLFSLYYGRFCHAFLFLCHQIINITFYEF